MELIKGADKKFYRAYDPLKQRTVGCLYIEVKGASKQARILREIDTLRELHLLGIPHVPKLYGVAGTYNEDSSIRNLSLYMEDYNGGDLIELPTHFPAIDRARLTARVAISVLETLKGCHALGI
ncbi:MAG: hypothetical protein KDK78_07500, partial [Chlamydiia bacterium]|nr:hypothetical protein [Chlamydiia bacterium]